MAEITITLSAETAQAVIAAMYERSIRMDSARNPRALAHREAAKRAADEAQRTYREVLAAFEEATR